jgi:3-oxoacyl-[acyl-carrier protein] reductase
MELNTVKALVTGAASGMGFHFAKRLKELGAEVAACDVNEAGLAELPAGIHRRKVDVSKSSECAELAKWAADSMNGLNVIVSNAGILRDGLLVKRSRETGEVSVMSDEQWQSVINVNLSGATFVVREGVAEMVRRGQKPGVVIAMSSVARHGNRGQSNYVSAKAALAANAVTWCREFALFGIRAVAIAPGMVETPMTRGMNQKARDAIVATIPVGRIGEPEDLFKAVRFAIECDYLNGFCIDVDGGASI